MPTVTATTIIRKSSSSSKHLPLRRILLCRPVLVLMDPRSNKQPGTHTQTMGSTPIYISTLLTLRALHIFTLVILTALTALIITILRITYPRPQHQPITPPHPTVTTPMLLQHRDQQQELSAQRHPSPNTRCAPCVRTSWGRSNPCRDYGSVRVVGRNVRVESEGFKRWKPGRSSEGQSVLAILDEDGKCRRRRVKKGLVVGLDY